MWLRLWLGEGSAHQPDLIPSSIIQYFHALLESCVNLRKAQWFEQRPSDPRLTSPLPLLGKRVFLLLFVSAEECIQYTDALSTSKIKVYF